MARKAKRSLQAEVELKEMVDLRAKFQIGQEKRFIQELEKIFEEKSRTLQDTVRTVYEKHPTDEGSFLVRELFKFKRDVGLKNQVTKIHKEYAKKELQLIESHLLRAIQEEYEYQLYTLDALGVSKVTDKKLASFTKKKQREILESQMAGRTIKELLQSQANEEVAKTYQTIITAGNQNKKLVDALKDIKTVTTTARNRTVLTFQTELTRKKYETSSYVDEEYNIDQVEYLATLDQRTCKVCGPLDGQVFEKGKEPTIPTHPRCRCTYVKFFEEIDIVRRARNPVSGKNYLTDNTHYSDWRNKWSLMLDN